MELQSIVTPLTTGALGGIIGYLMKSLVDHWLAIRKMKKEREEERIKQAERDNIKKRQYQNEYLLIPLAKSLDRLVSRLHIAITKNTKIYGSHKYVIFSTLYDFCSTCYWLERLDRDPKLTLALHANTEKTLRSVLFRISGIRTYDQKIIGDAMSKSDTTSFGPISYGEFRQKQRRIFRLPKMSNAKRSIISIFDEEISSKKLEAKLGSAVSELSRLSLKLQRRVLRDQGVDVSL